jgi:type II secretory pathway predicted ATPase ExeA
MNETVQTNTRRPFLQQPGDEGYFVPNPGLSSAMLRLRQAVTAPGGVAVVSGGPGVGKSAFVEKALAPVADRIQLLRVDVRSGEPDDLYDGLLVALGDDGGRPASGDALRRLRQLLAARTGQRPLVLSLDVPGLNVELARRVLRLVHVTVADRTPLSLVLQGPHTLHQLLDVPGMIQLRQRVGFRMKARPLSLLETAAYIRHCLAEGGQDPDAVMAVNAPASVYLFVAGVPRLINTLMDAALAEAQARQAGKVDGDLVRQVAEQLGWKPLGNRPAADGASPATAAPKPARKAPAAPPQAARPAPAPPADPLPMGDITRRLVLTRPLEPPPAPPAPALAVDAPKPAREARPPPPVPMDASDTGATGMLRLEDLDPHFAETLFSEDSGHFKVLLDAEKTSTPG